MKDEIEEEVVEAECFPAAGAAASPEQLELFTGSATAMREGRLPLHL